MDKETLLALGAMLVSIVLVSIPICIVLYLLELVNQVIK